MGIVALVIGVMIGLHFASKPLQVGTTVQGGTYNTSLQASVAINLATPGVNATSSTILNTDANDRYISAIKVGCENIGTSKTAYSGGGLATLTLKVATSSTAAPLDVPSTNLVGGGSLTIATSTPNFGIASSTMAIPGVSLVNFIWAAGSNIDFTVNATNTAVCTVGVDYFKS